MLLTMKIQLTSGMLNIEYALEAGMSPRSFITSHGINDFKTKSGNVLNGIKSPPTAKLLVRKIQLWFRTGRHDLRSLDGLEKKRFRKS